MTVKNPIQLASIEVTMEPKVIFIDDESDRRYQLHLMREIMWTIHSPMSVIPSLSRLVSLWKERNWISKVQFYQVQVSPTHSRGCCSCFELSTCLLQYGG
ncbi:hypothetical protein BYT27DRAFT_7184498 [Phlegmacium glaucopus]|nr:hypothetical protein BYT27DRAFT_7184498 [Phlegmacium glaucopus]